MDLKNVVRNLYGAALVHRRALEHELAEVSARLGSLSKRLDEAHENVLRIEEVIAPGSTEISKRC